MIRKSLFLVLILCLVFSSGCTAFTLKDGKVIAKTQLTAVVPSDTPPQPTALPIIITATRSMPATRQATITPTTTVAPSQAVSTDQIALATPTHTGAVNTPISPATGQVLKIFLVAIGDNGASGPRIGCDDSLVAVEVSVAPTVAVLRTSLNELLAIKTAYYGQSGLYNALYQSDLSIDQLGLQNGLASIYLIGDLVIGGTCDGPRVLEQLRASALQFSTVTSVEIFINNVPLEEVLSQK